MGNRTGALGWFRGDLRVITNDQFPCCSPHPPLSRKSARNYHVTARWELELLEHPETTYGKTWWTAPGLAVILLAMLTGSPSADETFTLKSSIYYSALQTDYPSGNRAKFRGVNGEVLATGSHEFLRAATIEGSAVFADDTVLNIVFEVGGEMRWQRVWTDYGIDARGCPLVPFLSAAVDPAVIPLGARLMIAETRGMALPDGKQHDGIWIATDTGAGIDGHRIDLFAGRGIASLRVFEKAGIDYLRPLRVTVIDHSLPCP